jgi:hypothetical protein
MPTQIPSENRLYHQTIQNYKQQFSKFIFTSRFNNQTWYENQKFVKEQSNIGCIYCSPSPICKEIAVESILFILEMNNETNKILGVGMVRNHPYIQMFSVYSNSNYNRYSYKGKYHIAREEMTKDEDQIFTVFDILCFTGNYHMKRGQGLTMFPIQILKRCEKVLNLVDYISNMFKRRLEDQKVGNTSKPN